MIATSLKSASRIQRHLENRKVHLQIARLLLVTRKVLTSRKRFQSWTSIGSKIGKDSL